MAATTPVTLLERLRHEPDGEAWQRLTDLYTPILRSWLGRQRLNDHDAEDVVQEVLRVLVRRLPEFEHNGRNGAFRAWLRSILANQLKAHFRQIRHRPQAGNDRVDELLQQLEDPASELSRRWAEEHDRAVVQRLMALIAPEFEATTWDAFRRLALDGIPTAEVANELGLTVNAVRIAKSRVMRRLRKEAEGLID